MASRVSFANQPLLANLDRGELPSLNLSGNRIGLHAQDFRRLSRGISSGSRMSISPPLYQYITINLEYISLYYVIQGKIPEFS